MKHILLDCHELRDVRLKFFTELLFLKVSTMKASLFLLKTLIFITICSTCYQYFILAIKPWLQPYFLSHFSLILHPSSLLVFSSAFCHFIFIIALIISSYFYHILTIVNSPICADVPLRNYSLTHSVTHIGHWPTFYFKISLLAKKCWHKGSSVPSLAVQQWIQSRKEVSDWVMLPCLGYCFEFRSAPWHCRWVTWKTYGTQKSVLHIHKDYVLKWVSEWVSERIVS